ncbi:hypothetical protein H6G89_28025 [Oscillatoria sp. FACHB-1407]|uniref:hypothetical protein n=1 Tax=Oscillatoria sp. FACHB-1407 TaxID=2692847 RepID=UPI001688CC2A|nr:hypothetical protein [Oscillatoria sp. FACHB-1407]MBD2464855.1 hypothetical protein [Oscillatoria sp. FACHB-1407]
MAHFTLKQCSLIERWQVGDRIEGPEPEDQGIIAAIEGYQLVIQCGEGITIYGRQATMEKMQWRLVRS